MMLTCVLCCNVYPDVFESLEKVEESEANCKLLEDRLKEAAYQTNVLRLVF